MGVATSAAVLAPASRNASISRMKLPYPSESSSAISCVRAVARCRVPQRQQRLEARALFLVQAEAVRLEACDEDVEIPDRAEPVGERFEVSA